MRALGMGGAAGGRAGWSGGSLFGAPRAPRSYGATTDSYGGLATPALGPVASTPVAAQLGLPATRAAEGFALPTGVRGQSPTLDTLFRMLGGNG